MRTKIILAAVGGIFIGLGSGLFLGRKLTLDKMQAAYDEALNEEIAITKAKFNEAFKKQRLEAQVEPEITVADLENVIADTRYGIFGAENKPDPITLKRNIFMENKENETGHEDYAAEDAARDLTRPFVIDVEDYLQGDLNHSQSSLTYFQEDDVLIDENDGVIPNQDRIVGEENLVKFGHRSGDPRIVYVRNLRLSADYEIQLDDRSYGEVVHGIMPGEKQ